jgi:peptidoglycan hydrolase CwlO-like protein
MGFGRGLGRYFGWNDPQTKQEKIDDLKAYLKALEEEIEDTKQQLAKLK